MHSSIDMGVEYSIYDSTITALTKVRIHPRNALAAASYTLFLLMHPIVVNVVAGVSLKRGVEVPRHATFLSKKKKGDVHMHVSHEELLFASVLSSY